MAITKEVVYDKTEIVGDYKAIQCREATIIKEDGVEISRSYTRHVLHPSKVAENGEVNEAGRFVTDGTFTHTDTDISGETAEIQAICNAAWTDEVKAAFKTWGESLPYPPTNT
jgi:hypothetical protein